MSETEVRIPSGAITLAGTLTVPDARSVVLCLHGTGPLDRDENMPGQRLAVFDSIATHLAAAGVATLRYDKRGCGASGGDYIRAGQSELLADATAAFDSLARFERRFVLGHSEGTLLAARLSLTRPVAGLVMLNPFVQPLEQLLMAQARQVAKDSRGLLSRALGLVGLAPEKVQRRLIDKIRASTTPTLRHFGQPIAAKSLRELMALDPRVIYAQVDAPMLLIAGDNDIQCDPADASAIAALNVHARAVVVPDLTHILRRHPGRASFADYAALARQPIDPEVLALVASFVG